MNDQKTLLVRIGRWFRKEDGATASRLDNENLPLMGELEHAGNGQQGETRSTFLRPWAKRDAAIANLQEGFGALAGLMTSIRDNLDRNASRQEELMHVLQQLPQALQQIPENNRVQGETLRAIHQQIEFQSGQQSKLAEILERISSADRENRSMIDALHDRVESLHEHDQRIADNLNSVGVAMKDVSRNSQASTEVLGGLRDTIATRDRELERILHGQHTRFTTMLAISIALAVAALAAVCVIGYLGYEALARIK